MQAVSDIYHIPKIGPDLVSQFEKSAKLKVWTGWVDNPKNEWSAFRRFILEVRFL